MGILDGLLATDGDVLLKSNHPQIRFTATSKELALNIRRLLLLVGCHGRISSSFADDGGIINGRKIIRKHRKYDVSVSGASAGVYAKKSLLKKLYFEKGEKLDQIKKYWLTTGNTWKAKITSIEPLGLAKVYDIACEDSDTWITDGYIQRGCGEQPLLSYEPCFAPDTMITTKEGLESIAKDPSIKIGIFSGGESGFQLKKIEQIESFFHKDHIHVIKYKHLNVSKIIKKYKDFQVYLVDDVLNILYNAKKIDKSIITIWIKRGRFAEQKKDFADFRPDFDISDLKEIISIVEGSKF